MVIFDDTLAVWINGFFVLAALGVLLTVASLVMLLVSARSTAPAAHRSATRQPAFGGTYPESAAAGRAA